VAKHPHRERRKQLADVEAEDADVLAVSDESDESGIAFRPPSHAPAREENVPALGAPTLT
jgi:hypothetical protein